MNAAVAAVLDTAGADQRATVDVSRERVAGRDIWTFVGYPAAVDEAVRKKRDDLYCSDIMGRCELADGRVQVRVIDRGCD